jgi:hypothetical protein
MIRGRALPLRERERGAGLDARGEHDLLEKVRVDESRAGAREEPPSGCDERHRQAVDVLVSARRPLQVSALFRERGGIADHDLPGLFRFHAATDILEDIGPDEVLLLHRKAVPPAKLARELERRFRGIDADRPARAAGQRRDREGSGVGKEVEDGPPGSAGAEPRAVLTLVQVEAGLLAAGDVRREPQAVLEELDELWSARAAFPPVRTGSTVALGRGLADDQTLGLQDVAGRGLQIRTPPGRSFRQEVHHRDLGEDVHEHARTEVPFRVHRAEARGRGSENLAAQATGRREPLPEERNVGRAAVERPEARDDLGPRGVGATAESGASGVDHLRDPVRTVPFLGRNRAREDPGVPAPDGFFAAGLQSEADQGRQNTRLPSTRPKKKGPRSRGPGKRRSSSASTGLVPDSSRPKRGQIYFRISGGCRK